MATKTVPPPAAVSRPQEGTTNTEFIWGIRPFAKFGPSFKMLDAQDMLDSALRQLHALLVVMNGNIRDQNDEITEDQVALAARLAHEVHQLHQIVAGKVCIEALIERGVVHG